MMRIVRHQMPVGQGCFHVGSIEVNIQSSQDSKKIRYIYDCGSQNKEALEDAIDLCIRDGLVVNALFISHFDNDHVSGLDELLSNVQVDTVYIPYVNDSLHIISLLEAEGDAPPSASLIEATIEPEIWFGNRGVKRVVRVLGTDDASGKEDIILPTAAPLDGPISEGESVFLIEYPEESLKVIKPSKDRRAEVLELRPGGCIVISTQEIVISTQERLLDWFFLPHVDAVPIQNRKKFKKRLRETLGLQPGKRLTSKVLVKALLDPNIRKKIRECYGEIVPNGARHMHNRISMSLYSGPIEQSKDCKWEYRYVYAFNGCACIRPLFPRDAVGWLGTGDATLKVKKVREKWEQTYRQLKSNVSTLLLPHHGSLHNFHPDLLSASNLILCVASAGKQSPYKHPSCSVIHEISAQGKIFCHVSEDNNSGIVEIIELAPISTGHLSLNQEA